ncbi:gypsy-16 si [Solea senegalensis]|uniref:Gypsy-16 si n=1 Tax=Solea senegalensis TaxID=28829 RepID=A0AAV6PD25_SOLSE|nr:gypsy-16 si [Solea senegalensis]KAG7486330.1 gypsy-16 si [Solea senegalensis]
MEDKRIRALRGGESLWCECESWLPVGGWHWSDSCSWLYLCSRAPGVDSDLPPNAVARSPRQWHSPPPLADPPQIAPVDPKVTPVIQPLRRLPLALRDGVAAKLWICVARSSPLSSMAQRYSQSWTYDKATFKCPSTQPASREPTSVSQVASFLGVTIYYLCFLPHYSDMVASLCQLLRKDDP